MIPLYFLVAAILGAVWLGARSFKIIGQAEVMVIERLGRFHRVASSGFNFLIPFIEQPRSIDVRYLASDAPVGEHLADQLLPLLALAGAARCARSSRRRIRARRPR